MKNSPMKSAQYGAFTVESTSSEDDFESGNKANNKSIPDDNISSNKRNVGIITGVVGVSMILFLAALSQTNLPTKSMITNFTLSKVPVMSDGAPPVKEDIPDSGMAPSSTIPLVTEVPISTSRTFGLNRVGYSYIPTDNKPLVYTNLASHTTVIEPHADTSLWLASPNPSLYYKYSVCNSDGSSCATGKYSSAPSYESSNINMACTPGDKFILSYNAYDRKSEEKVSSDSGTAACSYVRREIRALSTSDLAKTMDAMYALWAYDTDEGARKYGSGFKSASYFTNLHHFNAAWQDSDHIHEGNGFIFQHLKMTNMFEESMQAVDPSVSLPYWDYTIDTTMGRSAFNSFIMTPEVFGSMTHPADITYGFGPTKDRIVDAAIPNGRWAGLKAETTNKYHELQHPFGYVRAPWNMNPSPYISRFTSDYRIGINLPSCTSHYKLLMKTDMMDFSYNSAFDAHATTHSMIGGVYGCELLKPLLDQGYINNEDDLKQICSKWIFNLKELYRFNFIAPMKSCAVDIEDVNSASCGFTCLDEGTSFRNNVKMKLGSHVPADISDEGIDAWADFICRGDGYRIFAGDHLESASPADPSFWVIHPTLERLYQAKLMGGGFDTMQWPSDVKSSFVCEKSRCFESSSRTVGYHEDCCYGHYEDDQLYNAEKGSRAETMGLTNAEVVTMSNPTATTYAMPYIYDSFAWSHCSDDFNTYFVESSGTYKPNTDKLGDVVTGTKHSSVV